MEEKVIVDLTGMEVFEALSLAEEACKTVWGFRVNDLVLREGISIIKDLCDWGKVLADVKLHDDPEHVATSVALLKQAGATLITVHALGGPAMLKAAVSEMPNGIVVSTILPSISDKEFAYVHNLSKDARRARVTDLAFIAHDCRAKGIICTPAELEWIQHYRLTRVGESDIFVPGFDIRIVSLNAFKHKLFHCAR